MATDTESIHLEVESGPDRGRGIRVSEAGIRIGRAVENDVELTDPAVSRFQCRLFFKDDGCLWIADLGSTNQTLVNRQPVIERALAAGDGIEMGDSVLRVLHIHRESQPSHARSSGMSNAESPSIPSPAPPVARVDLGLQPVPPPESMQRAAAPVQRNRIFAIVGVAAVVIVGAVAVKLLAGRKEAAPAKTARLPVLEIGYEKVRANPSNIFRYDLALEGKRLRVQVDSLTEQRHIPKEKDVTDEIVARLAGDLDRIGFFQLDPSYQGIIPDVHESTTIRITLGARTHEVRVLNRIEPESFIKAREIIEEFARNELGLAAVSLPPEKLMELGRDSMLLGRKLFSEREVRNENLWKAIQSFEEAQWYAETLEPKPEFFADAVAGEEESKRVLQEMFENYRFQADRAIQLRDWSTAAMHLQTICAIIPDREDQRHGDAAKRLLDVERRIQR